MQILAATIGIISGISFIGILLIHFWIKSELERDLNDLCLSKMVTETEFLRYQDNSQVTALLGELRATLNQLITHRESYSFNQLCCHCWVRHSRRLDRRANALLLSFLIKTNVDLTKAVKPINWGSG